MSRTVTSCIPWLPLSVAMLLGPGSVLAQQDSPSVFTQIGGLRLGADEGSIGTTVSFGGGIAVPIHRRLITELDVLTGQTENRRSEDDLYRTQRTMVLGNLLYRWRNQRVQVFAGGGLGGQFVRSTYLENYQVDEISLEVGEREIRPGVFEFKYRETRPVLFAPKGGFVVYPWGRLGIRAEVFMVSWHMGVRIGISYRLKGDTQGRPLADRVRSATAHETAR